MERNTTIDFQILAKIINRLDWIWLEEDGECNGHKIAGWWRGIENQMKKLGADEQMQKDIYETHCIADPTYKVQCDRLRARGYTIINNGKK